MNGYPRFGWVDILRFQHYCVMFGGFQYYQSQQLLSEVRRTEVIRYILSSDPTNKAMIEKIDTVFREKGVDAIYNQVK